jgi:hypothetical protein
MKVILLLHEISTQHTLLHLQTRQNMKAQLTQLDSAIQLEILQKNINDSTKDDLLTKIINAELPPELVTRLEQLWTTTKTIGSKVIHLGKLIFDEIYKFITKYPHLTIGVAITGALQVLITAIPFIGPILAPIIQLLAASIGFRLDTDEKVSSTLEGLAVDAIADAIKFAKEFFLYLIQLFKAAWQEVVE